MSKEEIKEDINEDINEVFDIYIQNQQLRNKLKEAVDINISLQNQLQQKENIIKEVREYIENNKQYAELEDYGKNGEYYIDEIGLLEILDKGDEK